MMDIETLKQLALSATPGPWWIDSHGHAMVSHSDSHNCQQIFQTDDGMGPAVRHESTGNLSRWRNDNDASYIAAANPKAILELIDELESLRQYKAAAESQKPDSIWQQALLNAVIDVIRADKNNSGNEPSVSVLGRSIYELQLIINDADVPRPVTACSCAVPEWENEAKRAFWCGLEIGAGMGAVQILPRWNEYIAKRKGELSAIPSNSEGEKS